MANRFTETERQQMSGLRAEISDCLTMDLDTDFNIGRWIQGWKGDIGEASRRLRSYIENRKATGLDDPQFLENFHAHPIVSALLPYFSMSITPDVINPIDNTLVILQRFENIDYHTLTKVMTCGQFLLLYLAVCEWDFRQVLKRESETGRQSGLTLIFDLDNFQLLQYANPNSAIYKIFILCLCLLQDYYCNMLHRLLIVNAPSMVNMVLEIVKRFLNPITQQKLTVVAGKEDLFKYVHPSALPSHLGGRRQLTINDYRLGGIDWNLDPKTCCIIPKAITEIDMFKPRKYLEKPSVVHIKPKQKFEIRQQIDQVGVMLAWQFTVHSDVQFGVYHVTQDGTKTKMAPCLTVATPKLPEEGTLICHESGEYIFEFTNVHSNWFSVKLEYYVHMK